MSKFVLSGRSYRLFYLCLGLQISHEAPVTGGFGAEISATILERCFLKVSKNKGLIHPQDYSLLVFATVVSFAVRSSSKQSLWTGYSISSCV